MYYTDNKIYEIGLKDYFEVIELLRKKVINKKQQIIEAVNNTLTSLGINNKRNYYMFFKDMEYLILKDLSNSSCSFSQFNEVLTIKCVSNKEFEKSIKLSNSYSWQPYHGTTIDNKILLINTEHLYCNLTAISNIDSYINKLNSYGLETKLINEVNDNNPEYDTSYSLSEYSLTKKNKGIMLVLYKEIKTTDGEPGYSIDDLKYVLYIIKQNK